MRDIRLTTSNGTGGSGSGALVAAAVAQLENKTRTRLSRKASTPAATTNNGNCSASGSGVVSEDNMASAIRRSQHQPLSDNEEYHNGLLRPSEERESSVSVNTSERETTTDDDEGGDEDGDSEESNCSEEEEEADDGDSNTSDDDEQNQRSVMERLADGAVVGSSNGGGSNGAGGAGTSNGAAGTGVASSSAADRGKNCDGPDDSSLVKCDSWSGSCNSSHSDDSSGSGSEDSDDSDTIWAITVEGGDTSTCCDDDFQWIKSSSEPPMNDDDHQRLMSPAPHDTDDEEEPCRTKIVKSKRSEMLKNAVCAEKPPMHGGAGEKTGSLDRRRHHPPNRMDRDQKSRSSHNLKSPHYSPSRQYNNANNCENYPTMMPTDYCNNRIPDVPFQHAYTPPRHVADVQRRAISYEHFNRRHEHTDPQRYGSSCALTDPRSADYNKDMRDYYHSDVMRNQYNYYANSRHDLHSSHGELCCTPNSHFANQRPSDCYCRPSPPYWCSCSEQSRYRTHCGGGGGGFKNSDMVDDRVRRLETDKDSLQLQVSVLSDQIAAQTEKITDLERLLGEKRNLLANAEELLQREILTRSSLETQKLELMQTVSEARLRQAALERENLELKSARPTPVTPVIVANGGVRRTSHSPSPSPSPAMIQHARDNPPRTPPATYRRLVNDASPHQYSSLPRGASLNSSTRSTPPPLDTAVVLRSVGFADKDTIIGTASSPILGKVSTGKGWGSLFKGGSGGALEDITDSNSLDPFQRGGVRATAAPRLQSTNCINNRWSTTPIKEWDTEISCEWLESLGLDCYNVDAKKWLTNPAGNKGILAGASQHQIEKELNIKNPLHKKKIWLALQDLLDSSGDPLLSAAGRLDTAWTLRWLEDAGLPQYREAWAASRADGRVLHRLCHEDLHLLKVTSQLHALSIRRGIQVLRENNFSPDTMIRRGMSNDVSSDGESVGENEHVSRWSSHRVMEWLRAVDLAEYAPNLRGAGVHGGLMYYEVRFTGELLATLLNIPPSKTLLRRHLNTRFNQLLGKEIIQEKREAEQTLGYLPLTLTSKVKLVKKGQFTLKRKKNKNEPEYGDLVCPIIDQASGEILSTTKTEISGGEVAAVCRTSDEISSSTDSPLSQRSDHSRS